MAMPTSTIESLPIPEESKEFLRDYLVHLKKTFHPNPDGIILFGSAARGDFVPGRSNLNLFLVFEEISFASLQQGGVLHKKWGKQLIVPPLLLTHRELPESCRVFPLEYHLIKESHKLLEGRDPFHELHVSLDHLGRYCEKEVTSNLLQIRQRFVEGEGRPDATQTILLLSITSLIPALRGILCLLKQSSFGPDMEILDRFSKVLHYDVTGLAEALKMKRGLTSPGGLEWVKVYERYLLTLTGLLRVLHSLRREGRI